MKAVIEIELEMDGTWKASDRDVLIDKILDKPDSSAWEIDEDRLLVIAKSMTVTIKRSRRAK